MSKRKLFILILSSCLILVGASFGITYAYLFANSSKTNEFTVGKNDIEVEEDFEPPTDLEKCDGFKKVVQIKNTGNIWSYVRVRVEFSDSDAEIFCNIDYHADTNPSAEGDVELWYENKADGYYYYKKAIPPYSDDAANGITSSLFDRVDIDQPKDSNDLVNFDIMVYAESCEAGTITDFRTAWGLTNEVPEEKKEGDE